MKKQCFISVSDGEVTSSQDETLARAEEIEIEKGILRNLNGDQRMLIIRKSSYARFVIA